MTVIIQKYGGGEGGCAIIELLNFFFSTYYNILLNIKIFSWNLLWKDFKLQEEFF